MRGSLTRGSDDRGSVANGFYRRRPRRRDARGRGFVQRGFDRVNRSDWFMWRNFYLINAMHRADVTMRDHYPLGDESWQGPLLTAN